MAAATKLSTAAPGIDPRSVPKGFRPRDLVDPTLVVEPIKIKTRDFR